MGFPDIRSDALKLKRSTPSPLEPVAIQVARELGVEPEPFILAVIFGANMSYATPFGYQTNLLLLSAGGYKFSDFLRAGVPLTLIMWLGFSLLLPVIYEL